MYFPLCPIPMRLVSFGKGLRVVVALPTAHLLMEYRVCLKVLVACTYIVCQRVKEHTAPTNIRNVTLGKEEANNF